jgi:hypothetical protein
MPKNVVVIGAVALGPKAACRFKRLEPDSRVVMVDKDHLISYGGCGIPYFISGDVSDPGQLQETSFHMLRWRGRSEKMGTGSRIVSSQWSVVRGLTD